MGDDFFTLIEDDSQESKLAREYLDNENVKYLLYVPQRVLKSPPLIGFLNSFQENPLPQLLYLNFPQTLFISFSGIKSFLRRRICDNEGIKEDAYWWKNVTTDYPNVTCFDKQGNKMFEGLQEQSPYAFQEHLQAYRFESNWPKVSCWKIGYLEEVIKKQERRIVEPKTQTVLFPDDIEILKSKKRVIVTDIRSIYDTTYVAYFCKEDIIFGLYAYTFD